MNTFLYFAYGSNMLTSRIRSADRCPTARTVGVAALPGYVLKWHKRSKDGSGKCDIVKSVEDGSFVHGVLFEISAQEKLKLDRTEGLGYGYDESKINVLQGGREVMALTYVATKVDSTLKPFDWYHAFVVDGAVEHSLPDEYIASLRLVEVIRSA